MNERMEASMKLKLAFLIAITAVTVMIHYGLFLEPLFGHASWIHAIHSRLCYVPIAVGAIWFGLRGGLLTAASITFLVIPFVASANEAHSSVTGEIVEIVYYFAIGGLIGALVDREMSIRRKHDEAQKQLDHAHRLSMVGQMAAGVAHEIKNPLASIKGAVEIVTDPRISDSAKLEFRDILIGEVRRIDSTVEEFLEFARPKDTRREFTNLSVIVAQTVRQLEAQFSKKNVKIEHHIAPDVCVFGDTEKIKQVLINVLINAAESSDDGPLVVVCLINDREVGAILTVTDNGLGIPPEQLERIYEPFFTTKPSGSGLGLAVVKNIVELHGGQIKIDSESGMGTKVRITFPLAIEAAVAI